MYFVLYEGRDVIEVKLIFLNGRKLVNETVTLRCGELVSNACDQTYM